MATSDIQRLRQQSLFSMPDIMSGYGAIADWSAGDQRPATDEYFTNRWGGETDVHAPTILNRAQPTVTEGLAPDVLPNMRAQQQALQPAQPLTPAGGLGVNPQIGLPEFYGGGGGLTGRSKEMMDVINQIYTPDYTSRDRLNKLLDSFPQYEEPSFARKLVAGGMGWGAKDPLATMNQVLDQPFIRDVEAWKTQAVPFGQAAQYEIAANANERNLASSVVKGLSDQEKYQTQLDIAAKRDATNRYRIQVAQMKNEGWQLIDSPNSPTYKFRNSKGDIRDSGIPTGSLTQAEEIDAKGRWGVKAAEARGEATVKTAEVVQRGQTERTESTNKAMLDRAIREGWDLYEDSAGHRFYYNPRGNEGQKMLPENPNYPSPGPGLHTVGTAAQNNPASARPEDPKDTLLKQQLLWANIYNTREDLRPFFSRQNGILAIRPMNEPKDTWWPDWGPFSEGTPEDNAAKYAKFQELMRLAYPGGQPGVTAPSTPVRPNMPPEDRGMAPTSTTTTTIPAQPTNMSFGTPEQQQKLASGTHRQMYDRQRRPVGIVQNNAQAIAKARADGYIVD